MTTTTQVLARRITATLLVVLFAVGVVPQTQASESKINPATNRYFLEATAVTIGELATIDAEYRKVPLTTKIVLDRARYVFPTVAKYTMTSTTVTMTSKRFPGVRVTIVVEDGKIVK